MTPATIENVRAMHESGYSTQRIANELRLKRSEVQRAINLLKPPKQPATPKVVRKPKPPKPPRKRSTTANAVRKRMDGERMVIAELLAAGYDRYWRWRKWLGERHRQRCRIVAVGKMNAALIEFEDGCRVISSRYAVRRIKP